MQIKNSIKHIWFDFSETLAFIKKERHLRLRYETYAELKGKPVNPELISEYENLYQKFSHSNAAIFHSLGQTPNFWSDRVNAIPPSELYELVDPRVPEVLSRLRKAVPISLFSNVQTERILVALKIDPTWFTHILNAGMVKNPKPALDGFYRMVELSGVLAQNILYIGDDVEKDVKPAKRAGVQTGLMWKKSDEADYFFEKFTDILDLLD